MEHLGKRLSRLREEYGLSQRQLGEILCKSQATVAKYEKGTAQMDYATMKKCAEFFNVSADWLLCITDRRSRSGFQDGQALPDLFEKGGGRIDRAQLDKVRSIVEYALEKVGRD